MGRKSRSRVIRILLLVGIAQGAVAHDASEISSAARAFLATMDDAQRTAVQRPFDDPARRHWTNLPVGLAERPGLRYGELSSESRVAFHDLLTTVLSSQGYLKLTSIMQLDDILNRVYDLAFERGEIEQKTYDTVRGLDWSYENYFIAVWGEPGTGQPWGLKFGGHHISLNITSDGRGVALTPMFVGTDPAQVSTTRHAGLRVLAKEEDLGLRLINSLSDEQKARATLSREVPSDIITNPESPQRLHQREGIAWNDLNAEQQAGLRLLIEEYIGNLEAGLRESYERKLEQGGLKELHFAWIGAYQRGKPHYYIVHGPDFVIEYDNISWDKQSADHVHTIWREQGNDFGEDLLRRHYETAGHHASLKDFATRYAAAWSSADPRQLAALYSEVGSLSVNGGVPATGREAIAAKAAAFMEAFPDMVVRLEKVLGQGHHAVFHWHWTGTNTGPGGTGRTVDLRGYEIWTLDDKGLIVQSLGNYDAAEYARQIGAGG